MADTPQSPPTSQSGANQPAPAAPASAAASGAAAPSTPSPSNAPSEQPLQDWERRYSELERDHNRYKSLGDPDQVQQALNWARQVASEIQAGKLRYGEQQAPPARQEPQDPWQGWDELDDRQRAERIKGMTAHDLQSSIKPEIETLKKSVEDWQRNQANQMQLFQHAMRLAVQNPDVPFDDLISEATKLAAMPPQDLLNAALQAKVGPKKQQQLIDQAVQQKLAELRAEEDKKKVEMLTVRKSPRLLREIGKNPLERKLAEEQSLLEKIRDLGRRSA